MLTPSVTEDQILNAMRLVPLAADKTGRAGAVTADSPEVAAPPPAPDLEIATDGEW